MERNLSLVTFVLLCSIAIISWPALNAEEAKTITTANDSDRATTIAKLLDRIETLEQRIVALEQRNTEVRLVDNRDETNSVTPAQVVPNPQGEKQPSRQTSTPPRSLAPFQPTEPLDNEEDEESQKTNGKKWKIHLLKRGRVLESSSKIY